ncbi:MAG: MTH1187 family thiamine-binding protein [Candidatus Hermodarchaeota archaeon]
MTDPNSFNVICDLVTVTYDIGPSLSPFVTKVVKLLNDDKKVKHLLTPMGSILEGEWQDVLNLLNRIFTTFAPEYERLGITFKVDYRKGKVNRIEGKIKSVEEKL